MSKFCSDCGASLEGSLTGECNLCAQGRGEIALSNPPVSSDWREAFQGRKYTEREIKEQRARAERMKDMNLIELIRQRRKGLIRKEK